MCCAVSMGNLAQLAKQLTRLTSQPPEAGGGAQTPAEGAPPPGRRLTATGAGPSPVSDPANLDTAGVVHLLGPVYSWRLVEWCYWDVLFQACKHALRSIGNRHRNDPLPVW